MHRAPKETAKIHTPPFLLFFAFQYVQRYKSVLTHYCTTKLPLWHEIWMTIPLYSKI